MKHRGVKFFLETEMPTLRTLITEEEIQLGVKQLACDIQNTYQDQPLTILGVLVGSIVFMADLIRCLEIPIQVGVIQARSYQGKTTTPGDLVIHSDLLPNLTNRTVLLVDDIFDTGQTMHQLMLHLRQHQPRSVHSVVLLKKEGRSEVDLQPDHTIFTIPDEFVVGYGLDYNDHYRNLRYIAALDPADLEK